MRKGRHMVLTNNRQLGKTDKNNVIPFIPEGDFYFEKGVDAFYKRKFDIALKWLKKATEADDQEALYPCQMSIIYTEIGAYHAANQILTDVIKQYGEHYFDCYYLIANNYAHLGLLQDAQKYAGMYLEKAPDGEFKSETEQLMTMLDIDEYEYEYDEDWLEEEDQLLIYQETVFHHLERKEWEEAIPLLAEMMEMFPDYPMTDHEYSYALFFAGRREEAIEREEASLVKNPHSIWARSNLAVFYYHQGNRSESSLLLTSLENVYPIHSQQCLRIAFTFASTANYHSAYQRFLRIPKSQVRGYINYYRLFSLTAFKVGQEKKAADLWQEGCRQHADLRSEEAPWK